MEQTLNDMGERGDILRAMHNALKGQQRELVLETEPAAPVIGRIVTKGLADVLTTGATAESLALALRQRGLEPAVALFPDGIGEGEPTHEDRPDRVEVDRHLEGRRDGLAVSRSSNHDIQPAGLRIVGDRLLPAVRPGACGPRA